MPGAWWEEKCGDTITILCTDHYCHWTRDTGPFRCIQWIEPHDVSETFAGPN